MNKDLSLDRERFLSKALSRSMSNGNEAAKVRVSIVTFMQMQTSQS